MERLPILWRLARSFKEKISSALKVYVAPGRKGVLQLAWVLFPPSRFLRSHRSDHSDKPLLLLSLFSTSITPKRILNLGKDFSDDLVPFQPLNCVEASGIMVKKRPKVGAALLGSGEMDP